MQQTVMPGMQQEIPGSFKGEEGFKTDSGLIGLWLRIRALLAQVWTIVSGRHSGWDILIKV